MGFFDNIFGKKKAATPSTITVTHQESPKRESISCYVCGKELAGEDQKYVEKRKDDARYFYRDTYNSSVPMSIQKVSRVRDNTFVCSSCGSDTGNWTGDKKKCFTCDAFLSNFVQMGGVSDFYCRARNNTGINDPLQDSCPQWIAGKMFKR